MSINHLQPNSQTQRSPSRDPIGYLGSPNLFELNIFLKSVDPQGYLQQPISCQGVVVPVVGQLPRCSVLCACPGFQPHEPIDALMFKEMTEQEWKSWGFPGTWPGTYETQCNAIADGYEVLNICPDDGDGGDPVTPWVPSGWDDQPHCMQESWSPLDIGAIIKTGCGGGIRYGWRCVRWRWYTTPTKNPTKNPFVYPRKKPIPIKFPMEFPQAA